LSTDVLVLSTVAIATIQRSPSNKRLGPYLAGLIEGDGSILVPTKLKAPSGAINRGGFEICFHLRDYPLAEFIRSTVGGGFIRIRRQACVLYIRDIETVLKVIILINGHMRTPKIEALHRLIIWYNNKYGTQIPLLGLDETPIQMNSWLSGILDADAGFYLHWLINKKGLPISLQYYLRLSQRQFYHRDSFVGKSYFFIMTKIANLLLVPLRYLDRSRKSGHRELAFEVRSGSYVANYIILSYLIQYPLFSYKYSIIPVQLDLLRFSVSKQHKSVEGLQQLKTLKDNMNSYSASLHWAHIIKNFPR